MQITFVDLFAGIGGFRCALQFKGARCIFSNEIDKYSLKTYSSWYGNEQINSSDIRSINISKDIPKHDILCAGFPCQPFSLAGVSKKNSLLYKASDIQLLIPEVKEAGPGNIVPTSSTIVQLSIGDALAIATMKYKNFNKLDFKKFHPSGSLGAKLKTVEDLMLTGNKIPFINENDKMKKALDLITKKKLGVLIAKNSRGKTTGIITDGQIRRASQNNKNIQNLSVKKVMTKNPISVEKELLAAKALSIMNNRKITSLCIHNGNKKNKTLGIIHIHNILEANIQ